MEGKPQPITLDDIVKMENNVRSDIDAPGLTKDQAECLLSRGNSKMLMPGWPTGVHGIEAFLSISRLLHGPLYWESLRNVWDNANHFHFYKTDMQIALLIDEPGREHMMNKKERAYLESLPDEITIYRAMPTTEESEGFGMCWTLDKKIAEFFRKDYGRSASAAGMKMKVKKLTIPKSRAIAFLDGREEKEIIYIHNP